jgi:hypothetical protein
MAQTTTRRPPCPQCKRRRQRLRARSPLLNTLCSPVARWGFTLLAFAGFYAHIQYAALIATGLAVVAWRHA